MKGELLASGVPDCVVGIEKRSPSCENIEGGLTRGGHDAGRGRINGCVVNAPPGKYPLLIILEPLNALVIWGTFVIGRAF